MTEVHGTKAMLRDCKVALQKTGMLESHDYTEAMQSCCHVLLGSLTATHEKYASPRSIHRPYNSLLHHWLRAMSVYAIYHCRYHSTFLYNHLRMDND
jgi:hypothetical protein